MRVTWTSSKGAGNGRERDKAMAWMIAAERTLPVFVASVDELAQAFKEFHTTMRDLSEILWRLWPAPWQSRRAGAIVVLTLMVVLVLARG